MLCSPGSTFIEVPVNFAVIWSNPHAVRPLAGHETVKALTGGWWDVCSVRYETRTGFATGAVDGGGTLSDTAETFRPALSLRLAVLLPLELVARAAVSIRGALSSASQLH